MSQGVLGDWLTFRNGKTSPERAEDAPYPVYGSNGIIGHSYEANVSQQCVVIGRVGSYCGSTYYASTSTWVTDNAMMAVPEDVCETRFWFYALKSKRLNEYRQGSGQPLLNQTILRSIPFEAPEPMARRQIAATLGALDDKIDSNRRAINMLDNLARSQFVRWRSREQLMTTSTFGEFADVFGGATPKTKVAEYWGGDFAWATPTDVTNLSAPYLFETARTLTRPGLDSSTAVLHPPGTILMTSRATIGAFAINQLPTATNQGFIAVRPRHELHRWYLFEEMRSRAEEFISNANGSTFLEISRGRFKALPIQEPSFADLDRLNDALDPLHTRAAHFEQENQKLVTLRDALLPELLSGRIRAPKAAETIASA